jgi:hypothetical protein
MGIMITAYGFVVTGVGCCIVHDFLLLPPSERRNLLSAAVRKILSLVIFVLLTIGPFVLFVKVY